MEMDGFDILYGRAEAPAQEQYPAKEAIDSVIDRAQTDERAKLLFEQEEMQIFPVEEQTKDSSSSLEREGDLSLSSGLEAPIVSPFTPKQKPTKSGFSREHILKVQQGFWKEVKIFGLLFVAIFCGVYFFTNAQLVWYTISDAFVSVKAENLTQMAAVMEHGVADAQEQKAAQLQDLESKFAQIQQEVSTGEQIALQMQDFLANKSQQQTLDFNILPPTNRLIIPDLNINVPLVDTEENGRMDFEGEDFEDELTKGVVKYPTTPTPGNKGNALLFGHTSTEWWKKNDYGVVFRNIPKLKAGQQFHIVRNGQLTTYEMVERKVVLPKEVESYYHLFSDQEESFVTLMGCYPIGTADKRMMIVAKKVENPE